ncbi:MAG: BNR repeat-containing protein [Fibrobacterota bacterium]|nr:BNR repeat-containing protein [Chitinispirillaceae bacterium]
MHKLIWVLIMALSINAAVVERSDITNVWSSHFVDFALVTDSASQLQYVGFYDKDRKMTIAQRSLSSKQWQLKTLPVTTGWDSHDYISMAVDDSGYIHVSGNMHNVPLVYFRSSKPHSIDSFDSLAMTGSNETMVTYPIFIKGIAKGELFFQHRDNANSTSTTMWNKYSVATKKWTRLTTQGFFNTEGLYSAYMTNPVKGPDDYFHIVWMWRNTPTANTNHDLSHIRSKDLVNWETMSGLKVTLPIKQSTPGVVVDSVDAGNGLINIAFGIGWDSQKRAVINYHKYDKNAVSQRWNTRWENGAWKIYQTSTWTSFKWSLDRTGTLGIDISGSPVTIDYSGRLVQEYHHVNFGDRMWVLNEQTLQPQKDTLPILIPGLDTLHKVTSTFAGMQVHFKVDGDYYLRWETLPENQDKARTPPLPDPTMLSVYKITSTTHARDLPGTTSDKATYHTVVRGSTVSIDCMKENTPVELYTLEGKQITASKRTGSIQQFSNLARGTYIYIIDNRHVKVPVVNKVIVH